MTTIAGCSDAGILASDSRVSDGDMAWSETKIQRHHGSLYGAAGDSADCEKFFEYAARGCKGRRPKVNEDFAALALTPKGLFLYDCNLHPMRMKKPFAIGSGGKCARTAFLCGKGVREAVELACMVDAGSSLPVEVFRLEEEGKE